jgi:hypothetical protein
MQRGLNRLTNGKKRDCTIANARCKIESMKTRQRKTIIDAFEYTLTWPIWPETSSTLLEILRADVLLYLDYVTHDLAWSDPQKAAKEIQRAADRLKEIAAMLPGADDPWLTKVGSPFGAFVRHR